MIWTELLLFLFVCGIGGVAYICGRADGYKQGWFDGHQHATFKLLPMSHVAPYDHAKDGL